MSRRRGVGTYGRRRWDASGDPDDLGLLPRHVTASEAGTNYYSSFLAAAAADATADAVDCFLPSSDAVAGPNQRPSPKRGAVHCHCMINQASFVLL